MTINYHQYADNLWHDTEGFDKESSEEKYGELLKAAIQVEYSDANVNVTVNNNQMTECFVDGDDVSNVERHVDSISRQIFESDNWYVKLCSTEHNQ